MADDARAATNDERRPRFKVTPSPDGRGAPAKKTPMLPWSPRRFFVILIALFFLNWVIVQIFAPPTERITVPYNPTFLT